MEFLNSVLNKIMWAAIVLLILSCILNFVASAEAQTPPRANPAATATYLTLLLQSQGAPVKSITCKGVGKYVIINKGRSYLSLECAATATAKFKGALACFTFTPLAFPKYKAKVHPCVKKTDSSIGLAA